MARTTRSKKVVITEDNTAQSLEAQATPSTHIGSHLQPLAGNTMSGEDSSVELEVKGLKAAYREAIGVLKKSRRGKSKNKTNNQPDLEDVCLAQSDGGLKEQSAPMPREPPIQPPIARTTRRQAKAQEGSYDSLLVDSSSSHNGASIERSHDADMKFFMTLIAGRSTGPSRNPNRSISAWKSGCVASNESFLAEEALRNATTLEKEPTQPKENLNDQQSGSDPSEEAPDLAQAPKNENEDSFVGQIISRSSAKASSGSRDTLESRTCHFSQTPSKEATLSPSSNIFSDFSETVESLGSQVGDEDQNSFVEHICSKSPAKSRIEDSVEALDQVEEVEQALHEAAMAERIISSVEERRKTEPRAQQPAKHLGVSSTNADIGPEKSEQPPFRAGIQSVRVKAAPKRSSVIKKATSMTFKFPESSESGGICKEVNNHSHLKAETAPLKLPIILLPPEEQVKSTKPITRPSNYELPGEAIARRLKEKRELRQAQRESSEDSSRTAQAFMGPNVKSKKPLTRPTFELPGEAVSRKKREAHQAKVKAQEEEERKRREFKARPIPQSITSCVRDTIASRARQSKISPEDTEDGSLIHSTKTLMNVGSHRSPTYGLLAMVANTSAPRAQGPIAPAGPIKRKPSSNFHGPSMSGLAVQRTISATEVQIQRQRAKEIYNRDQKLGEDLERERREREVAAKRSREEAAERGRQASREWAEKQRAKRLAGGDKGASTGFGPGGETRSEA